jgi:ABC-type oligopeptide transport system substrate-binding subunit
VQADSALKSDLKFFARPAIWYIGQNPLVYAPFRDVRVRQAFAKAIDRTKICRDYLGGVNEEATGILPPAVLGHRKNAKLHAYNPEEARKLLAEAGFPGGKGLPKFTLTFREQRPDIQIVAEAAATMLKTNLGVEVELRTMEWRAYLDKHNKKEQGFYHMRWGADYLDPENFLSTLLATYGPENKVGYSNPVYDKMCSDADVMMDNEPRMALYAQAEDLVLSDAPFIPIYFQRDAELIRSTVKGLRESAFGHLPHVTVTVETPPKS